MLRARTTDPQTSHDAAQSISVESLSAMKRNILKILESPMPDEDLVELYNNVAYMNSDKMASPSGIRTSRSILVKEGLVVDTGDKVKLRSGRMAIIWQVAR